MEATYRNDEPVLLTASGGSVRIPLPRVDTTTDRLRVAWCLIAAGAAVSQGGKKIHHLEAYLVKTLGSVLEYDHATLRESTARWGRTVIYKRRATIAPLAIIALLVAGLTTDEFGDLVPAYEGMIDPAVQHTAGLLFGHPLGACQASPCSVCRAMARSDWHIAFKLATGDDYEAALGALFELYEGALADGLTAQAAAPAPVRPAMPYPAVTRRRSNPDNDF
jgi:hypothetical protein